MFLRRFVQCPKWVRQIWLLGQHRRFQKKQHCLVPLRLSFWSKMDAPWHSIRMSEHLPLILLCLHYSHLQLPIVRTLQGTLRRKWCHLSNVKWICIWIKQSVCLILIIKSCKIFLYYLPVLSSFMQTKRAPFPSRPSCLHFPLPAL